ncbi:HNH endonuclease [Brooklawnia cerclae]|uniref:5-methylcytosine-specific restriction endonuclease McrA n=1 Tax=Brooklawnia cerclae TaxID=349934 RepID=A0ABX0SFR7_9ACTN|nr:HNH endonuclease [Brooklawnia cerclae]NIH56744.1 5-methylcytosine-specific restriction endonuclease McrA [Brooklawnia cerclae]
MTNVLVLNADDTALHTVSVKHAIGMLVREVAIVEEASPGRTIGVFPVPTTLRLTRYVKTGFLYAKEPGWTKRGVLRRDSWRCAYCGERADTVDHVVPSSRGGTNTWHNTVACCHTCNSHKANHTPDEAGMRLLWQPFAPTRRQLLSTAA